MLSILKIEEAGKLEVAPPFGAGNLELSSGTGCYSSVAAESLAVVPEDQDLFDNSEEESGEAMVRSCLSEHPPLLVPDCCDFSRLQLCQDFYGLKVVQPAWDAAANDNHVALTRWLINLVKFCFQLESSDSPDFSFFSRPEKKFCTLRIS